MKANKVHIHVHDVRIGMNSEWLHVNLFHIDGYLTEGSCLPS